MIEYVCGEVEWGWWRVIRNLLLAGERERVRGLDERRVRPGVRMRARSDVSVQYLPILHVCTQVMYPTTSIIYILTYNLTGKMLVIFKVNLVFYAGTRPLLCIVSLPVSP